MSQAHIPFQLMFGHQAILPIDIDLQKESGDELHHKYMYQVLNDPDIVRSFWKMQKSTFLMLKRNKSKSMTQNVPSHADCFQEGELVMKKNFRRK